jgi:uncharacterized protein (TIGR01244 family)
MVPVALSDIIAVGEVPTAAEIEILAKAGFKSLLTTQPDGEVARLMASADAHVLARAAGLTYRYLPIVSRRPDDASLAAFAAAIAELPRPIYACCYSGARSAAAWALAAAPHLEPEAIVAACSAAGYDIAFLRPKLAERRAQFLAPATVSLAPVAVAPMSVSATAGATTGTMAADFIAAGANAKPAVPSVPTLTPSLLVPRAASAGGFAVAG